MKSIPTLTTICASTGLRVTLNVGYLHDVPHLVLWFEPTSLSLEGEVCPHESFSEPHPENPVLLPITVVVKALQMFEGDLYVNPTKRMAEVLEMAVKRV